MLKLKNYPILIPCIMYIPQKGHNNNVLPEALDESPGVARVVHNHGPVSDKDIVYRMSKKSCQFLHSE